MPIPGVSVPVEPEKRHGTYSVVSSTVWAGAQKTLHKILSSPACCDTVTLSSHLWTHNSGSSVVADSALPARRWCDLKDAVDSIPAEQSADQESFANRKLIRPTLNRTDHNHNSHGHAPAERRDRDRDRDRDRSAAPAKKVAPTEQTNAENFYYQKQMQSKTPMVIVLRDGEEVHGYIEWYDKNCIKLNRSGAANLMIYKPAIKYMFKEGENERK
jgi:host factor-I protein